MTAESDQEPETYESGPTGDGESTSSTDDFLGHLYRGSELLMQDRVVEARAELEHALLLQPQDAKGQDLLAGVYFRLGIYPQAIEIWERLAKAYPKDAALRVNLALALLKAGQSAEALEHVHVALQIDPDHERAWSYLGLIQWRLGRLGDAHEAFVRGGQGGLARNMEEVVGIESDGTPDTAESAEEKAAVRSAAERAMEEFESDALPLSVEASHPPRPLGNTDGGRWQTIEPGEEPFPSPKVRTNRQLPAAAPPRLRALLSSWAVALPEGTPLAVGPTGDLFVHARHAVYVRLDGLRAVRGELRVTSVQRHARGREMNELLGGDRPLVRWRGPVAAILSPPPSERFYGVACDEDVLYVREELLWAFDDQLGFESGRLPLAGEPVVLTQIYGSGTVILCLARPPAALRVEEGTEVRVDPRALIGWTGRLFPSGREGTAQSPAPPLAFRGDGFVLVG